MLSEMVLNLITTGVADGSGVHRYHLEASQYRSLQIVSPPLPVALAN